VDRTNKLPTINYQPKIHALITEEATSGSHTMKASNFASHGNFGPILAKFLASLDGFCTKHEQNKVFKSIFPPTSIPAFRS
jgi:hypothetical protein